RGRRSSSPSSRSWRPPSVPSRPPSSHLPGLLGDVDSILEDSRVESANPRGLLDVGRGLTDGLDIRPGEEDLVPVDFDFRFPDDPRLSRELLPEEVFDDELGSLYGGLQREVTVADLHILRDAIPEHHDHVCTTAWD